MTKTVAGVTAALKKLKLTLSDSSAIKKAAKQPKIKYHKRRCNCPFCGLSVVMHKLARHQQRARCKLAQLQRRLHGFDSHD